MSDLSLQTSFPLDVTGLTDRIHAILSMKGGDL
jgi:hypothetical protein